MHAQHISKSLLLVLLLACTGKVSDSDTADTADTDPCAGALDREAFIAKEVERICDYGVTCPGKSEDDRDFCMADIERTYRDAACFDACVAKACSAWLDTEPTCTDESVPLDPACFNARICPG
jgi:hypothetical protein